MLKINDKTFLNIQEAVQWLMDNNALPFQCTANYVPNAEIGLGTIVNPTMAKVRIGSLIFFADSKVSTVTGVTSNGFIVSDQYNDLVDDVVYVSNVQLNASAHLIVTLSNGTQIDAGLVKEVASFSINGSQHLIATFNDGSTNDLGAIFTGNVTISGDLTAVNGVFHGGVKSTYYEPDTGTTLQFSGNLNCFDKIVDANGNPRFIGGDIATTNLANLVGNENVKYAKWSLSGTHIMIVLVFNAPANTMFTTGSYLASLTIPSWIGSQIQRIIPSSAMVAIKEVIGKQAGEVNIKKSFDLEKSSDSVFTIWTAEDFTTTATNTGFRVQFDLLIE